MTDRLQPMERPHGFLAGGGEMGARIRALDWSSTSLGPIDEWPQSLRSPLSMLLPSKAQIILFWGPEFVVLYNDAYRPVFGAKHPHALGLPGRDAWSEIWDSMLHALLAGVVRTGEAFWAKDLLFQLERYGFLEETYFDVSYDPVRVESGEVGGVFCIVTETTERVVGERRMALLRDLAARNATARTLSEACVLAMETLAGRPDVRFALAYVDDELQSATPGATAQLNATNPSLVKHLPIPASGRIGGPGRLVVGLNPQRPFDDGYRAFLDLVAGQFGTALANASAYEEEKKRAEALAEIDRAKTAFFTSVSHEFRTPLTLMLGPLEELLSRETGEARDLVAMVHRNGQRLLKLVNTLLDYSRIEAGRTQAAYEPIDLGLLTADLASNFRAACDRAGLSLVVACDPGAIGWVDRDMWEKIVLNLLSNAFKFTLEGTIHVTLADTGDVLRLTVADTGSGIPAAAIGRVFERFHRVEGARGRSHEGSGIGLALVQELVRLHGGAVAVNSTVGVGTTFAVSIPTGSRHLPAGRLVEARRSDGDAIRTRSAQSYVSEVLGWLPGDSAPAPSPATSSRRVLLVDDNADLRDYGRRLLGEHYFVDVAADGLEALTAARAHKPDIVITDVMMPHLDGFGLIRELRADSALAAIPVLLLSARAGEEARLEGLSLGADDYLVKPFTARELLVRTGSLLQSHDVRQQALAAQRASEQHFRQLFESMDEGYAVIEVMFDGERPVDLQFVEVNPAFERQTGLKHARGRRVRELVPALEQSWFDVYGRVARSGETLRFENFAAALGRWFDVCAFPVGPSAAGRVGIVFNDITDRKRSERALREMDQRKDEFLATLSHELRNPLAPLLSALHLLRQVNPNPADPAIGQARAIMERQVGHLVRLVDDLLEVARINRNALELRNERVELGSVIRNALETSEPGIRAASHRLDVKPAGEPLWVDGDPVRLAQILANLLNNAAKYTPPGGLITVTADRDGAEASVSVRDTGQGIPADSIAGIFEMFNRGAAPGGGRAPGGLGIGLALSRRLATMHGGTLEARSDGPDQGSEFVVRLPLAMAPAAAKESAATSVLVVPPLRVLVVDDNRDAATSLGMVLGLLGAEVHVAHDGPSAVESFAACDPAVVLLDIGMPGMDGYEVARELRASDPSGRSTLVALTGWGQHEDRERSRIAGFEHHLVKPADIDSLRRLLVEIGRRRHAASTPTAAGMLAS